MNEDYICRNIIEYLEEYLILILISSPVMTIDRRGAGISFS